MNSRKETDRSFFNKQRNKLRKAIFDITSDIKELEENPQKISKWLASNNFNISTPTPTLSKKLLDAAEKLRRDVALEWLGEELPPSVGWCDIRLRPTRDLSEIGSRTSPPVGDQLFSLMWLTCAEENLSKTIDNSLGHEMVHVVLNTRFPGQIPSWADEGAASLRDDPVRVKIVKDVLNWFVKTKNWPPLGGLLEAKSISEWDKNAYAASVSLTEYLLTLGDRSRFLEFAVAGKKDGWDSALQKYYGIKNVSELEKRWQEWLTEGSFSRTPRGVGGK